MDDEPKYLRRQKPLEIKRRKFGKQAWQLYLRVTLGIVLGAVGLFAVYQTGQFLLFSPRFLLADLESIEVYGLQYVPRAAVLEKFTADRGRSVLRVPLDERRVALEEIAWIEQATCQRILPNRLRVEIQERVPVAFLKEVELARPRAAEHVSEVDLADASDLRATLVGLPELGDPAQGGQVSVLVHFGADGYQDKFRVFLENIGQWRAAAGRVESVDLRFERQVVVNPEAAPTAANAQPGTSRTQ